MTDINIPPSKFKYLSSLTGVVNTSLDDIIQGVATGCLLVPHLAIQLLSQHLGHVVVVLGQVGELLLNFVVEFEVVVGVSERHDCFQHCKENDRKDKHTQTEAQDVKKQSISI